MPLLPEREARERVDWQKAPSARWRLCRPADTTEVFRGKLWSIQPGTVNARGAQGDSVMSDHSSFANGYIAGWKAVMGDGENIPEIPTTPELTLANTHFQLGIRRGIIAATNRIKSERLPRRD
jgi:hypothetical protein